MTDDERSPAEKVPVEILPNILQHLSTSDRKNARLVNSRWYQSSLRLMFQKRQKFVLDGLTHENHLGSVLDTLENAGFQYYDLEFHNENFHTSLSDFSTFIKSNLLYIYSLSFVNCSFPFLMVEEIMINCINLEKLSFKRCSCVGYEKAILLPNFKEKMTQTNLTLLEVLKCEWLTDYVFELFIDNYPNINRIRFCIHDDIKFTANFLISLQITRPIFLNCPVRYIFQSDFFEMLTSYSSIQLEELSIHDPHYNYDRSDFEVFLLTQKNFRALNVKWCEMFYLDSLEVLFDLCPNLKRLSFSFCYSREYASVKRGLEILSKSEIEVMELQLYSCFTEDATFPKFPRNRNTYYLNLSSRYRTTLSICNTFLATTLKVFCNLTYLDVSKVEIQGCSREVMTLIFWQQNHLRYLKLNQCPWIGDSAFKKCYLPKLEYLELKNARIKRAAFRKFDFPKLKFLCLEGCSRITDESFLELPSKCPQLRYLNVKGTIISEKTVLNVCENLKNLHCLNIVKRRMPPILNTETISQHCPSLRFIQMGKHNHRDGRRKGDLYVYCYLEKKWNKHENTAFCCIRCQPSKRRLKDLNF